MEKRQDAKESRGSVKEAKNFNPEEDGEKIHEAVKGFGTDEQPLIDILAYRTNAQRQQIKTKYKDKYDKVCQRESLILPVSIKFMSFYPTNYSL